MRPLLLLAALLTACSGPAPENCASGEAWTGGNEESPLMHPGLDCIACHQSSGEGPKYTVAGTVMPAQDDPDDCFGSEGVNVILTDADGVVHETTTNAAGNFFFTEAIAFPYNASLEKDGATSAMTAEQSEGSCATCHTAEGLQNAPGRIVAP